MQSVIESFPLVHAADNFSRSPMLPYQLLLPLPSPRPIPLSTHLGATLSLSSQSSPFTISPSPSLLHFSFGYCLLVLHFQLLTQSSLTLATNCSHPNLPGTEMSVVLFVILLPLAFSAFSISLQKQQLFVKSYTT